LTLVKTFTLVACLSRQALSDRGEELGHAGEVATGLPVLPADLAEGELRGIVERKQEEPLSVLSLEPAIRVERPHLPLLSYGLLGRWKKEVFCGLGKAAAIEGGNGRSLLLLLEDRLLLIFQGWVGDLDCRT